jgi:hypothetical protein
MKIHSPEKTGLDRTCVCHSTGDMHHVVTSEIKIVGNLLRRVAPNAGPGTVSLRHQGAAGERHTFSLPNQRSLPSATPFRNDAKVHRGP